MGATTIHLFWYEIGNEGSTHESERGERRDEHLPPRRLERDWLAVPAGLPLRIRPRVSNYARLNDSTFCICQSYSSEMNTRILRGHFRAVVFTHETYVDTWKVDFVRSNKKITRYLFSLKRRVARDICLVYVKLLLVYSDVSYIVYPWLIIPFGKYKLKIAMIPLSRNCMKHFNWWNIVKLRYA